MIASNQKTSLLIESQLPSFIRDNSDYSKFLSFLQAYYEWLEQEDNVLDRSKNILNYIDIDNTSSEFLQYFINDFLPYFPEDALVDKEKAIKIARQLYQTKGTPASYQFLFKILYDSDFDVFYTKDAVFKASAGIWYVPKSLRLSTTDTNFLNIKNYRLFGETTKSLATVENAIEAGKKIEVFISDIERLFQSGEYVRVVDNNSRDVYFLNGSPVSAYENGSYPVGAEILRARVVGQISSLNIDPNNRGLLYQSGDPVIVYNGLSSNTGIGAVAEIGTVTTGSIKNISVVNGGYGYRQVPYSYLTISNAPGAAAIIGSLDPSSANTANVNYAPTNTISLARFTTIGNSAYSFLPNGEILTVANPRSYTVNEKVYQGISLTSNTFSANVTAVDSTNGIIYVANTTGTISNNSVLYGQTSKANTILTTYVKFGSNTLIDYIDQSYTAGETIYEGASLATATFTGTVLSFDSNKNVLHIVVTGNNPSIGANVIGVSSNTSRQFVSYYTANANTTLANALSFISFSSYPISSVIVTDGGGGISQTPTVIANSAITTDIGTSLLSSLGILAPLRIVNAGEGYLVSDKILITGGSGYGAAANITSVNSIGSITSVQYVNMYNNYSTGGNGYTPTGLPNVTVSSANTQAANAVLVAPGILGSGATFGVTTDRAGSITTILIDNPGEDYISTPNVSLKVQDIIVSNVSINLLPQKGDIVYQGANTNVSTYQASVDSIKLLLPFNDTTQSQYILRTYNYNSKPSPTLPLKINSKNINFTMSNYQYDNTYDVTGVRTYGDGSAKATAKFLNGLVISTGEYLNSQGQPSAFDVLQSDIYNNYTYKITVEKEISKYKDILLNLLHPTGMKMLGRFAIRSNVSYNMASSDALTSSHTLYYYTNRAASNVTMQTDFVKKSNNIITFNNLGTGVNIATFIFANSTISLSTTNGPNVQSEIVNIDYANNQVQLSSNVWLTFANVAYVTANSGSSVINISSLTGLYDIVNGGNYSNTANPLIDIVYPGDTVLIANNTVRTVQSVGTNSITVTSAITSNSVSLMSVKRTFNAGGTLPTYQQVLINGPIGTQYYPELTTESSSSLTLEDGTTLILLG